MGARSVVVGVVSLGLLAAGAVVADGLARGAAEDEVVRVVRSQLDVQGTPDVQIAGFPFLTQLVAGELEDVTAAAPGVTLDGVAVTDVRVDARDVSLEAPHRVGSLRVDVTVPTATIQQVVSERVPVDLAVDGDALRATGELLGVTLTAGLVPRVAEGRLLVDVRDVTLGPATLDVDELPEPVADRLDGIEVPLEGLPAGIVLTGAVVVPDGVRVTATGTDVVLEQAS